MFYVYEWYNIITNEIFYVGKEDVRKEKDSYQSEAINSNASALAKALREHRTFKGHTCEYGNQQPSQMNSD